VDITRCVITERSLHGSDVDPSRLEKRAMTIGLSIAGQAASSSATGASAGAERRPRHRQPTAAETITSSTMPDAFGWRQACRTNRPMPLPPVLAAVNATPPSTSATPFSDVVSAGAAATRAPG
jgi:hypothetical protein